MMALVARLLLRFGLQRAGAFVTAYAWLVELIAIALLLLAAKIWYEVKIAAAEARGVATMQAKVDAAYETNKSGVEAIAILQKNLDACVGAKVDVGQITADVLAGVGPRIEAMRQAFAAQAKQREKDYENAQCAEWGNRPICGAVDDRLRALAPARANAGH